MEDETKTTEVLSEEKRWEIVALLSETQKAYVESNKKKDHIIILLIVLMFLEAAIGYAGFVWYESQFEVSETTTVEMGSEGDNANAEYNDIDYHDNAIHNEN